MSRPRAGRLRVGVNLLWLLPGAAGGAGRYAVRLLRALTDEASGDVDVTILCNRRFPTAHADLTAVSQPWWRRSTAGRAR